MYSMETKLKLLGIVGIDNPYGEAECLWIVGDKSYKHALGGFPTSSRKFDYVCFMPDTVLTDAQIISYSAFLNPGGNLFIGNPILNNTINLVDEHATSSIQQPLFDDTECIYQFRYKEQNKHCVDYGKWGEWQIIDTLGYRDILLWIKDGYAYETRKFVLVQE